MENEAIKALDEAIERAGGVTALAKALGIFSQAVSQWRRKGIPVDRVLEVERLTGVPCWRLAPDIYPSDRIRPSPNAAQSQEQPEEAAA